MVKGKKTIRRTIRGNLMGFIGRHFWINFGDAHDPNANRMAQEWLVKIQTDQE